MRSPLKLALKASPACRRDALSLDHGASPAFIGEPKGLGYTDLDATDIVRLRDHGVTADFIRRANARGRSARRSAEELVELRIGGR